MQEPVVLDASLLEIPVPIKQKDGQVVNYVLRELSGDVLEAYMEENKDRMDTVVEDGKIKVRSIRTYKGMFTSLLKRCLYVAGTDTLVDEKTIKNFPGRVQQSLFKQAQSINVLTDESEGEAKNSPTGSGPGCDLPPGSTVAPSPDANVKPGQGNLSNG